MESDPNYDRIVDIRIIDSYYLWEISEESKRFGEFYRMYKNGEKPPLDQLFTICFKYANNTENPNI